MKAIKITMLCLLVLIQGVSQSYAAQMMANMSTMNMTEQQDISDMPCHQFAGTQDQTSITPECCDQDCQCHFLFSAMTQSGFAFNGVKPSVFFEQTNQTLFSHTSQNLYRPPIFA